MIEVARKPLKKRVRIQRWSSKETRLICSCCCCSWKSRRVCPTTQQWGVRKSKIIP